MFKNLFRRTYIPKGLIYADELPELRKHIQVLEESYEDTQYGIKRYRIKIFIKERQKFTDIMKGYSHIEVRKR